MQVIGIITRETLLKIRARGYTTDRANKAIIKEACRRYPHYNHFTFRPTEHDPHTIELIGAGTSPRKRTPS